jgi:tyrosyl-tRNA synthetase
VTGSAILDDLRQRDLVRDATDLDGLRRRLDEEPITLYAGFDPTAESLHVGNLVPLLLLRRFQLHGHRPLALAGGATGMIGDPGGRSSERNLLDSATLDRHLAGIKAQLGRLLDFEGDGGNAAGVVDNRDWTAPVGVLDFLRDVGKHMTVNQMLAKESVRARVASEAGISFTEFSYMLLQANDFWWLNEHEGCELQVGGTDQWGNITAGIELIRKRSGRAAHGLTVPLLTRADGQKFGKSVDGAVWLDPSRTSPYAFHQYFVNVDDRDVERFLLQLTFLAVDEVADVVAAHRGRPEDRSAQRVLARELTTLVHGREAAAEAERAARGFTTAVRELDAGELEALAKEIPTAALAAPRLGDPLVNVLVDVGLEPGRGAARRSLEGGGIYVNDERVGPDRVLEKSDLLHERFVMLRRGRKNRLLLVLTDSGPS